MREVVTVVPGKGSTQRQRQEITYQRCQSTLITLPQATLNFLQHKYGSDWLAVMKKMDIAIRAAARLRKFHQNRRKRQAMEDITNGQLGMELVRLCSLLGNCSRFEEHFTIRGLQNTNFTQDCLFLNRLCELKAYATIDLTIPPHFPTKPSQFWSRVRLLKITPYLHSNRLKQLSKCDIYNLRSLHIFVREGYGFKHLIKANFPMMRTLKINDHHTEPLDFDLDVYCLKNMKSLPHISMYLDAEMIPHTYMVYSKYTLFQRSEENDQGILRLYWINQARHQ